MAPFAAGGWPAPGDVLSHLVAWLTILFLAERLAPGRATALAAGAMARGARGTHPVLRPRARARRARRHGGGAAARAPARPAARPRAAALLAAALLALIAWQGSRPSISSSRRTASRCCRSASRSRSTARRTSPTCSCALHERRPGLAAVPGGPVGPRGHGPRGRRGVRDRAGADLAARADRRDHRSAARRVRGRTDRRVRAGGTIRERSTPDREHDPRGVVYRRSMTPVLAVLLLAAAQADGQIGETPAPVPRRPTTRPAPAEARRTTTLPEATAPQQAKPAAPRQQLRILAAGLAAGGLPAVPHPL